MFIFDRLPLQPGDYHCIFASLYLVKYTFDVISARDLCIIHILRMCCLHTHNTQAELNLTIKNKHAISMWL